MKSRILTAALALGLGAACTGDPDLAVTQSALSTPSCATVDLGGLDVTIEESGGAFVVTSSGTALCVGTESEIDLALDRASDDGQSDGTPLPAITHDGTKDPDTLPGTPLPAATE